MNADVIEKLKILAESAKTTYLVRLVEVFAPIRRADWGIL